jgi:hypothetical protein
MNDMGRRKQRDAFAISQCVMMTMMVAVMMIRPFEPSPHVVL